MRTFRLFLSSTFRDFAPDRGHLHAHAWPALRALASSSSTSFLCVDLRWGVTADDLEAHQTILVCLTEVARSDAVLVLLGGRYGWSHALAESASERAHLNACLAAASSHPSFPWVASFQDRSVTELEIRCAEHLSLPVVVFPRTSNPPSTARDETLVKRLLASLPPSVVRDGYSDLESLAPRVIDEIARLIKAKFPPSQTAPSPLLDERATHNFYADSRARVFVGQAALLQRLSEYRGTRPLVVTGASGTGKSALLAKWVLREREASSRALIYHAVGASPVSTELSRMIERLIFEILSPEAAATSQPTPEAAPSSQQPTPEALAQHLRVRAARSPLTIVVDALDQLETSSLAWIPETLPDGVTFVVSTKGGPTLAAAKDAGWPIETITTLDQSQREELIATYLGAIGKKMQDDLAKRLASASSSPLFLKVALDELIAHPDFSSLSIKLDQLLVAESVADLYTSFFERLEVSYPRVPEVLTLLYVARYGVSEDEMMAMLKMPALDWTRLFLALGDTVLSKSGLLAIFHATMSDGVRVRYLPSAADVEKARLHYAALFEERVDALARRAMEVPFQYLQANDTGKLAAVLQSPTMVVAISSESTQDLHLYLNKVGDVAVFDSLDSDSDAIHEAQLCAAHVLSERYELDACEGLLQRVLSTAQDPHMLLRAKQDFASLLWTQMRYKDAEEPSRECVTLATELFGPNDRRVALARRHLARTLSYLSKFDDGIAEIRQAIEVLDNMPSDESAYLAEAEGTYGGLLMNSGKLDEAEIHIRRSLKCARQALGDVHTETSIRFNQLANFLQNQGHNEEAERLFRRTIDVGQILYGTDKHPHIISAMFGLAQALYAMDRATEGEALEARASMLL